MCVRVLDGRCAFVSAGVCSGQRSPILLDLEFQAVVLGEKLRVLWNHGTVSPDTRKLATVRAI